MREARPVNVVSGARTAQFSKSKSPKQWIRYSPVRPSPGAAFMNCARPAGVSCFIASAAPTVAMISQSRQPLP